MHKNPPEHTRFTFNFMATRFSGLSHEDESRLESITVNAHSFTDAVEQLRHNLHDFRGSNSFDRFTVKTSRGIFIVSTEPNPLSDVFGILNYASFTLGEKLD